MTLKSVVRRGALATVAAASAVALAACGAGQISQTANQVAAVDGAQNVQEAVPGGVAIRDAHIIVDPESGDAALKFSVTNQERSNDAVYTLESVEVEGAGEAQLTPVTSTKSYDAASNGEQEIPRDCQMVVDYAGAVEQYSAQADANPGCITYISSTFQGPEGTEEIELFVTISSYIPEAGSVDRGDNGLAEGAKPAEASDAEAGADDAAQGDATTPAAEQAIGQINQQ